MPNFVLNLAANEYETAAANRIGNLVLKGYTEFYPETDEDDALYMIYVVVPDETIDFVSNVIASDSPATMSVIYNSELNHNLVAIRFNGRSTPK